ncbi:outer membrane beta-barrel protein [Fulvivirga sp. M361]|uniref:outer membrane beta-barrel protein n=1 Tax=Fulvivirga sp. M361 TaxID=2594266 RepID=UPI00117A4A51|nr:outer membrane beta-barrel protein [Fulvivirga sp. M361]TRX59018.1 outer membrane beta-barrel protein [Fulvivirga sp. M361]
MKKLLLFLLGSLLVQAANAQSIKFNGKVVDKTTKEGVVGANILLINIKDSTASRFAISDVNGEFLIPDASRAFYRLKIQTVNYKPHTQIIRLTQDVSIGVIGLEEDTKILKEVEITGQVIPVEQKGDTTLYRADAFATNPDASVADLVSKMPGITVSDTGVEANGESVQQVLLDGKRFFGQDPLLALNTIPAEVVNQVEVFDQQSERSQFTGFDDGNTTKTMNVVTKEDKRSGQFGKFYSGIGTDSRYLLEGNINDFKNDRQLSVLGMSNNINKKNFSDSDITGVRSGRRGGNRFLGGGAEVPIGITQTESFGLNYSNQKKDKWKLESSYFYDRAELDNETDSDRETFLGQGSQFYTENSVSNSVNKNHRFNARLEYNFDEQNSMVFTPSATIQDNESLDITNGQTTLGGQLLNQTQNNYSGDNSGVRLNGDLLFRHKFEKLGRSLLFNVRSTISDSDRENTFQDLASDSSFLYLSEIDNHTYRSELTYIEPVGSSSQLQFSYVLEQSDRTSDIITLETTAVGDEFQEREDLSNRFNSTLTVHRPSVNLGKRTFSQFYSVELALQYATLDNEQVFPTLDKTSNSFVKLLPSVSTRMQLGDNTNLFVRYNTQVGTPSSNQLQQVVDNSNPLFYSVGNADLEQSYTHQLFARLRRTNVDKNRSLSNFIRISNTSDFITNATFTASSDSVITGDIVLPRGGQISQPLNIDGYWNLQNNTTYSFVIAPLKLNMSADIGVGFIRSPGIVNGLENISETYNGNARLVMASNISQNVDFNLSYGTSLNRVENTVRSNSNNRYTTQTISGKLNLILFKGFVFRSDINYQIYRGISEEFDTDYALWNASVAKKFLKNDRGELTIRVFDILGQNQSITQQVTSAYLGETRSLVLEQYWMFSFTYQLRRFKTNS